MRESEPFPEIIEYIQSITKDYKIELNQYTNEGTVTEKDMKKFLRNFIDKTKVTHVVSGTRSTDPYAQNLEMFVPTDTDKLWPKFTRVLPIYDWSYNEVWDFILRAELPYCELYKRGYTYVGDQTNTSVNPFIAGKHAAFANDNTELFSRTKLINGLPTKNGKFTFDSTKTLIIVAKQPSSPCFLDYQLIEAKVLEFCAQKGHLFEGKLDDAEVIEVSPEIIESGKAFEGAVIMKKQQPGMFSQLFLGVIVNTADKSVEVRI